MNATHLDCSLADANAQPSIGVFDSGVGGLSVLRALHRRLPSAPMVYVGDVSHAPYGERPVAEILERCERIVGYLQRCGARLIVVACNTATVTGITHLRQQWSGLTFVGVEPGIKPAVAHSRIRRIAVMTTPTTANSERLRRLIVHHAAGRLVRVVPCPGLAAAIERGATHGTELLGVLQPCCDRVREADVDTLVLGCTHYAFVADTIRSLLGEGITLIDTASAIAARVASLWQDSGVATDGAPVVRVMSTGAVDPMRLLLAQCPGIQTTPVEPLAL